MKKYYSYSRSRSRSFPRMEASDSLSRTLGMDFFIPFPFPNFGNGFFSFPSRSRILGMGFFHSLPIPEIWEWIFLFPSRSRISGMGFFNSLPVPEFREWAFSIPFPFPNPQKSFPLTPGVGRGPRRVGENILDQNTQQDNVSSTFLPVPWISNHIPTNTFLLLATKRPEVGSETSVHRLCHHLYGVWVRKEMVTWGRGQAFVSIFSTQSLPLIIMFYGRGMYEDCWGLWGGMKT